MSNSPYFEMPDASAAQWVEYEKALLDLKVPVHARYYWERWVCKWLDDPTDILPGHTHAELFSARLEADGVPEWMCRQAHQAIALWVSLQKVPVNSSSRSWADLIREMEENMRVQNYSPKSRISYLDWVKQFARRTPLVPETSKLASQEVDAFLRYLTIERNLAPTSISQCRNALAWLVRRVLKWELVLTEKGDAHHSKRLPQVVSSSVVRDLLAACEKPWDLFFGLQYGCGLRLGELLDLRIHDVDMTRQILLVRRGKGDKDRRISLPAKLMGRLEEHLHEKARLWKSDVENGWSRVDLPHALGKKLVGAENSWEWQHLFGAPRPLRHPETGEKRRWHPMESLVRETLRDCAKQAGISQRFHPHLLRHCYATHLLEAGVSIKEIQDWMGHSRLQTTLVYLHVRSEGPVFKSPLDLLEPKG